jgi:hypothetical protein
VSTATAWSTVRDVTVGRDRLRPDRALAEAAALVPGVMAEIAERPGSAHVGTWRATRSDWTSTGTATFVMGLPDGPPSAVLRMSATGGDRLRHETRSLAVLGAQPALAGIRHLFPVRHAEGVVEGWWYTLDRHIGGVDATAAIAADAGVRAVVLEAGARVATELHRATAVPVSVDDALLDRWVEEPIGRLVRALHGSPLRCRPDRLDRLRRRLRDGLAGRRVDAGWIHGDFWPGNLRVDPGTGAVVGVIDWDCSGDRELPAHDLLHLALYGVGLERGVSLGMLVADVLAAGTWPAACEEIVRPARRSWGQVDDRTVVLLYWLRYVAAMAEQHRSYAQHSLLGWQLHNVRRVLRCL